MNKNCLFFDNLLLITITIIVVIITVIIIIIIIIIINIVIITNIVYNIREIVIDALREFAYAPEQY